MRNLVLFSLLFSTSLSAESLYQVKGTTFNELQLTPAEQQKFYDLEVKRNADVSALIDEKLLNDYVMEQSAKKNKSKLEIEADLLNVTPITDKEAKDFYNSNKSMIPYP